MISSREDEAQKIPETIILDHIRYKQGQWKSR